MWVYGILRAGAEGGRWAGGRASTHHPDLPQPWGRERKFIYRCWRLVTYPLSSKWPLMAQSVYTGGGDPKEAPLLSSVSGQLLPTYQDGEQAAAELALGG